MQSAEQPGCIHAVPTGAETCVHVSDIKPIKVFQASLWMMLHGAESAKHTILYSPMSTIQMLDLGPLTKAVREERTKLQTVRAFA